MIQNMLFDAIYVDRPSAIADIVAYLDTVSPVTDHEKLISCPELLDLCYRTIQFPASEEEC
jgi:hypothetical protein